MFGLFDLAPATSAVIAAASAAISAWSAAKSARNSDRQHAVSYTTDISKWASEVLSTLPHAIEMYNDQKPLNIRFSSGADAGNRLASLHDSAAFLFPDNDIGAATVLEVIIVRIREDTELLKKSALSPERADGYTVLRTGFIEAIRRSIGVNKRHLDAQKYLA